MFNKKKIILNHIRASKKLNKKSNNFLLNLSHILIERANLNRKNNYKILEVGARTKTLLDQLKKNNIKLYVSGMSAKARGYDESLLEGFNAEFAMPDKLIEISSNADTILCY